jgi:formylglycine-generating enzyme required for sulfatase activity
MPSRPIVLAMLLSSGCRSQAPVGAEAPRQIVTQEPTVVDHASPQDAELNDVRPQTPAPAHVLPPFPALPEPTHAESRCPPGMAFVPGGRWTPSQLARVKKANDDDPGSWPYSVEIAPATPDFCLDLTEVTFGAVARCVAHGACPMLDPHPKRALQVDRLRALLDGSDLETWKQAWSAGAELPISGVPPREVIALCSGLGLRVPTLEEWLWAAWGGREDRKYPWGKASPDPTRLNITDSANVRSGDEDSIDADGFNFDAPVGSYPRGGGRWGHLDLAGNVAETVFPTLAMMTSPSGRQNDDFSEYFVCGLDYSYQDDNAPVVLGGPRFREWRRFPCLGPTAVAGHIPDPTSGFRCAADPIHALSER